MKGPKRLQKDKNFERLETEPDDDDDNNISASATLSAFILTRTEPVQDEFKPPRENLQSKRAASAFRPFQSHHSDTGNDNGPHQ